MIILQFNNAYHRWGLLMARSLALHEPHAPIFVDAMDLTSDQVGQLEQANPALAVKNVPSADGKAAREFMAGRKPLVLLEAMERFPSEKWYGLFDADMLVRRPLSDLWAKLADRPASLIRTDGIWQGRVYEHLLVPSTIVLLRQDGRALVESWARWHFHADPLCGRKPGEWFWDQCTLLQAVRETKLPHANLLMDRYADATLSPSASIWSAHHGNKDELFRRFSAEHLRQRSAFREAT